MIDYTLFGFTMAILLVGIWYACTSANISGKNDVEDDGRGDPAPPSILRRRRAAAKDDKPTKSVE
jgi:hypothetical protein